jgi:2-dehydropantoate 2-reductase
MGDTVGVVGAGALGSLLATRLAAAGHAAHVLARDPARRAALLDESPRIHLHRDARDLPSAAIVFLCVKAYDADEAASALARGRPAAVCSLQNGLGNLEALEARLPGVPLVAGATWLGAYLDEAGALHASTGGRTELAPWGATDPRWAEAAAALLRSAGLIAEVRANALGVLWTKLVLNAAINPLPALSGRPNGVLLEAPALWRVVEAAAREAARVGIRVGALPPDFDPGPMLRELVEETRENRGSMTEDLARGRRTEADAILGSVVRAAREVGEPVPNLDNLWKLIGDAEAARRAAPTPGPAP